MVFSRTGSICSQPSPAGWGSVWGSVPRIGENNNLLPSKSADPKYGIQHLPSISGIRAAHLVFNLPATFRTKYKSVGEPHPNNFNPSSLGVCVCGCAYACVSVGGAAAQWASSAPETFPVQLALSRRFQPYCFPEWSDRRQGGRWPLGQSAWCPGASVQWQAFTTLLPPPAPRRS